MIGIIVEVYKKIIMKKQIVYRGCELESPLYRQIAAEISNKKGDGNQVINEYKTKRGKYSKSSN